VDYGAQAVIDLPVANTAIFLMRYRALHCKEMAGNDPEMEHVVVIGHE
jgi:hypothetical protein